MSYRIADLIYGCRVYAEFTGYDSDLSKLNQATNGSIDLNLPGHRDATIKWLRAWGCRNLAEDFHAQTSLELLAWWTKFSGTLPNSGQPLRNLNEKEVNACSVAYDALRDRVIGFTKRQRTKSSNMRFGPTAASKTMYAILTNSMLPWDDPIRKKLRFNGDAAGHYGDYLLKMKGWAAIVTKEAQGKGISANDIPKVVGRPNSSIEKMLDECNWVYITRGAKPVDKAFSDKLSDWV